MERLSRRYNYVLANNLSNLQTTLFDFLSPREKSSLAFNLLGAFTETPFLTLRFLVFLGTAYIFGISGAFQLWMTHSAPTIIF